MLRKFDESFPAAIFVTSPPMTICGTILMDRGTGEANSTPRVNIEGKGIAWPEELKDCSIVLGDLPFVVVDGMVFLMASGAMGLGGGGGKDELIFFSLLLPSTKPSMTPPTVAIECRFRKFGTSVLGEW